MVFATSLTLFLVFMPSLVNILLSLSVSFYWFGRMFTSGYSFRPWLMMDRLLICYVMISTSIAAFAITSYAWNGDFQQYISNDMFLLGMGMAILGYLFTTIFVAVRSVLLWSDAHGSGKRKCYWYLAFLPLWLCCFLGEIIVFCLAANKMK